MSRSNSLSHPNCYWIPDSHVIAGEFPSHPSREKALGKIRSILDAGVTAFVDLTQESEFLTPYYSLLREEADARDMEFTYDRLPIVDNDVPAPARMAEILDHIAAAEAAGRTVYLHCWGGVGRTGTVVGCYLVRSGLSGSDALAKVGALFSTMSPSKTHKHRHTGSPQTGAQRDLVRTWAEHDASARARNTAARRAARSVERLLGEYGSPRAALRAIEAMEERDRRDLSVMERVSGPLGAQAAHAEVVRRLRSLVEEEPARATEPRQDVRAGIANSDLFSTPSDVRDAGADEFEVDIDAILRELEAEPVTTTPTLLPVIRTALQRRGLTHVTDEANSRVSLHLEGDEAVFECHLGANEKTQIVQCLLREPLWVPEEARVSMCEAITRANFGLPFGNFEMDMSDGELRYRTSMDVEGGELVPEMVDNLIGAGAAMCNRYHPAFMRVIYGGISPEQAIMEVES